MNSPPTNTSCAATARSGSRRPVPAFILSCSILLPLLWAEPYAVREDRGIRVHFLPRYESRARASLDILLEVRRQIADRLGLPEETNAEVVLVPTEAKFNQMVGPRRAHLRYLGIAFSPQGRILINLARVQPMPTGNLYETLHHEMVHVMLGAYEREHSVRLPRWFHEGVACWLSRTFMDVPDNTLMTAANLGNVIPFYRLAKDFPEYSEESRLAYLQSESFIRFLVLRHGDDAVARILNSFAKTGRMQSAVPGAIGTDLLEEEDAWLKSLRSDHPILWVVQNRFSAWSVAALLTVLAFLIYRFRRSRILKKWSGEEPPSGMEEGP